jgi:hypothetical protein
MSDRQRQQRIADGARIRQDQPIPTDAPQRGLDRIPGVVRSVDAPDFKMRWQAIRYQTVPPQKDAFEHYGEERDGYPLEGLDIGFYSALVWTEPFATGAPLVFAYRRNGAWIIEPLGIAGVSRCVVINAPPTTSKFIRVVRLKYDDQGRLVPSSVVNNVPVQAQVRCWDNTDSNYWSFFRAASPFGPAPTFEVTATTAVVPLLMIDGAEMIVPVFDDALETDSGSGTRGDCA